MKFSGRTLRPAMVVLVVALLTGWSAQAFAAVKFAHVAPPFHGQSKGVDTFAAYVKEKTDGRIDIATFPASQLGGETSLAEQVQSGSLQLATLTTATLQNFVPQAVVFDLPFLFPDRSTLYSVLDDADVQKEFFSYFPKKGFVAIGWTENDFRDFSNSKRPIHTPDDMKGLKVRVIESPVFLDMFRELGASPVGLPFSDVYNALQTGVIDAQENPILTTALMNFTDVNKYITLTHHTMTACVIIVSIDYWESLSDADKQLFHEAAKIATDTNRKGNADLLQHMPKTGISVAQFARDHGAEIVELTPEERAAFKEKMQPVWQKYRSKIGNDFFDLILKKIDEYKK